MKSRIVLAVLATLLVLALWQLFVTDETTEPEAGRAVSTTAVVASSTEDVCSRYFRVIDDTADSLIGWAEARTRMQLIFEDSEGATPLIQQKVREATLALNDGDTQRFITAGTGLGFACIDEGVMPQSRKTAA